MQYKERKTCWVGDRAADKKKLGKLDPFEALCHTNFLLTDIFQTPHNIILYCSSILLNEKHEPDKSKMKRELPWYKVENNFDKTGGSRNDKQS